MDLNLGGLTGQLPNQLSKYLNGLNFPADKENVVKHAESRQADNMLLGALKKLPPGVYKNINDVAEKIGVSHLMG